MDPVGIALTLAAELLHIVETVKGNKEQCKALAQRAQRVTGELQRLPRVTLTSLADRGTFVQLQETLRSAAEFCREFSGQHFLRRMLSYRADADRFDNFNRRLAEIVQDAELALVLDERAWRDAQQADNKTWDTLLNTMEAGFSDVTAGVNRVSGNVEQVFGRVDNMAEQLAETKALVASLLALQSSGRKDPTASSAAASGHVLHDIVTLSATWEINPREIKIEQQEDEFGMLRPVSLGSGAFGEVHKGMYRNQGVAIKTIKFNAPSDEGEFLKEVTTMIKLRHPNIVVFVGAKVVDSKKGLMVMEMLECSLNDAIYFPKNRGLAWSEKLKRDMTLQIAQGMAYLHTTRPRITHSDLKPHNVMLTERRVCRIIDFGLSVAKESSRMVSHDPRIKAGNGTLYYQAPELLEAGPGVKRDHKIDVYAYGVSVLELFQEQPPFPRDMLARDIEVAVKRGDRPAVARDRVPVDIVALVALTWHQHKERRPEFTSIVSTLLAENGGAGVSVLSPSSSSSALAASNAGAGSSSSSSSSSSSAAVQRERERMAAEEAALKREVAEHEERMAAARASLELEKARLAAGEKQRQELAELAAEQERLSNLRAIQEANLARDRAALDAEKQRLAALGSKAPAATGNDNDPVDVVRRMNESPGNADVQKHCAWLFQNIVFNNTENQLRVAAVGGVEALVAAMTKHRGNADVQHNCLRVVVSLALHSENQAKIAAKGGIEAVLAAITAHRANIDVQHYGLRALTSLSIRPENQAKVAALGGIEVIVGAMQQHRNVADIQHFGCWAFQNLAFASDTNQNKIPALGGIDAIVAGMNAHKQNTDVQHYGCRALVALALLTPNQIKMAQVGGLEAVVFALGTYKANADIQHYGLRAIVSISIPPESQKRLIALGATDLVYAAMLAHRASADVQQYGCWALQNLAFSNTENQLRIGSMGAVEAIVAAMGTHRAHADVQHYALRIFVSLALQGANQAIITAKGGIEATLAAMATHKNNVDVQHYACRALTSLAIKAENQAKIAQLGGIEAIVSAMQQHVANVDVQQFGTWALDNITWSAQADLCAKANRAGALAAVRQYKINFPNADQAHADSVIKRLY